ncbi:hypothetical protein J6590_042320 [Homalodisca vitripennis]|nr:hypothetical protein J6590_093765 [Homalodisca vitripennis]KAG8316786.1 hypothetical protein J6590_042320 [Homalodisca vitripennis]
MEKPLPIRIGKSMHCSHGAWHNMFPHESAHKASDSPKRQLAWYLAVSKYLLPISCEFLFKLTLKCTS